MFETIVTLGALATAVIAYFQTRAFVRRKLQFVDAVQGAKAPLVGGALATLVALPITWVVPYIGLGTALIFGVSVGAGIASGARDVRKRLPHGE